MQEISRLIIIKRLINFTIIPQTTNHIFDGDKYLLQFASSFPLKCEKILNKLQYSIKKLG